MNKIIALILSLIMIFTLCACNESTTNVELTPKVKVGFIYLHDEQSTYDLNFLEAAKTACEKLKIPYINKTNVPEGQECFDAAVDLVDQGCTIVFGDSFGHEDYLIQAAKEFPNVQFCHATGTKAHTENLSNFHNAFASIYEGRFLAGIAAGLKLNAMIEAGDFTENEALMGYVGAHPYAEVISGYTAFYLGAKYVCPNVKMKVIFTGTWYDETLEKEAANALIQQGCKLISQHADSMGAPGACEVAGVPNVTYNGSTINVAPKTYIISSKINWEPYFEYIIQCVQAGKPIDTDWTGTIETDSVQLTAINDNVAAPSTAEVIALVKADLLSGKLHVFDTSTWTVKGKHINTYMADVDSDPAYTGDTEAIINGTFYESKFRSAPYFDITIDGIEILGS